MWSSSKESGTGDDEGSTRMYLLNSKGSSSSFFCTLTSFSTYFDTSVTIGDMRLSFFRKVAAKGFSKNGMHYCTHCELQCVTCPNSLVKNISNICLNFQRHCSTDCSLLSVDSLHFHNVDNRLSSRLSFLKFSSLL